MKIYERPSVEIKKFDVEDIMTQSGEFVDGNTMLEELSNNEYSQGVVFEW